jgi:hypothetical protein
MRPVAKYMARSGAIHRNQIKAASRTTMMPAPQLTHSHALGGRATIVIYWASIP